MTSTEASTSAPIGHRLFKCHSCTLRFVIQIGSLTSKCAFCSGRRFPKRERPDKGKVLSTLLTVLAFRSFLRFGTRDCVPFGVLYL